MGGAGSYVYDGNYKRVKATVNGKVTYSVYGLSGQLLYTDKDTDNKATDYIRAAGQTIARIENGVVKYVHNDLLGSPVRSTNANSSVNFKEDYTPFGEKRLNPDANKDNVGFTGHVQDDATGLTYMQARYYDPDIGRFLSIDPVGFSAGSPMMFNRYAYANNNPYRYIDPDGREIVSANSKNNSKIEKYINSRAKGIYKFNDNNKLQQIRSTGGKNYSSYYGNKLAKAIGSKNTITVNVSDEHDNLQGDIIDVNDDYPGGGITTKSSLGDSWVTVSEVSNDVLGQDGGSVTYEAADKLAHEFLGHAIPNMKDVGSDTGNAIENTNKMRRDINKPLRYEDPRDPE